MNLPSPPLTRRQFIRSAASLSACAALAPRSASTAAQGVPPAGFGAPASHGETAETMIGAYGAWADNLFNRRPARLSYSQAPAGDLEAWRRRAVNRFSELLARPATGGIPTVTVAGRFEHEGVEIEDLAWQLPYGPPSRAYLLKPAGASGPLPGLLAMHDHGGNKYFGREKLVRTPHALHPIIERVQAAYYGGRAWANELAKRGFVVLVPDAFTFGSRRVLLRDVPDFVRQGTQDVGLDENEEEIAAYNRWAGGHEHVMAKSLLAAGTTWPGVFVAEDQRALDVLAARPEVDSNRLGCCGLSGGGLRTVMLAGIDGRVRAAVTAGMMTTWSDLVRDISQKHTWMLFVPLLPQDLDYPDIFTLQLPAARMVLNNLEDPLFSLGEMRRADRIMSELYRRAGAPEQYACEFHPGPHKFDVPMQDSAFAWLDRQLK